MTEERMTSCSCGERIRGYLLLYWTPQRLKQEAGFAEKEEAKESQAHAVSLVSPVVTI